MLSIELNGANMNSIQKDLGLAVSKETTALSILSGGYPRQWRSGYVDE